MGGSGSGNWWNHSGGRRTVESCRRLDVRRWQREGYLTPGRWFSWQWTVDGERVANIDVKSEDGKVILSFRYREGGGEWESVDEPVYLETSPGTYGGHRVWFLCPALGCGRRVAFLHLGGKIFACRHCYRLAYSSSREPTWDRLSRQADKIRTRLGWEAGMLNGEGLKPKWMRWSTYNRLTAKHEEFARHSMRAIGMKYGMFGDGNPFL